MSNEYGAVDLSGVAPQPDAVPTVGQVAPGGKAVNPGGTVTAPLIVDVDEASFEQAMAVSESVPVVLFAYAASSLASKQTLKAVEDMTRLSEGAFQLARLDVEANPALATALQLQSIPAGYALVGRRPVPLFEGTPTPEQLTQVLGELLQAAQEMGLNSRIAVGAGDLETPLPPEHEAAREMEQSGNWEEAISAWKKVLANNPGDTEAKDALKRAEFQLRLEDEGDQVDQLFAQGSEAESFAILLEKIAGSQDSAEKEELRVRLVQLLQIGSDREAVNSARQKLATILLV